jgi:hypothetical protein
LTPEEERAMKIVMQDSLKKPEPSLTGLDYFRQAAEDSSRQPPPTLEEMRAQSKRNRESRQSEPLNSH